MSPQHTAHNKPTHTTNGSTPPPIAGGQPFENEPLTDFSRDDKRQAMLAGLATVKKELGKTWPMVIGGQRVSARETFPSVNPSRTQEVVGNLAKATKEHALQGSCQRSLILV